MGMIMKHTGKFIAAMLIAAAAISCNIAEMDKVDSVLSSKKTFVATLENAGEATKTSLGTPDEDVYPVYWSAGDNIKIFTSGTTASSGEGSKLTLSSGAGTNVAVFSGDVPELTEGENFYYAVYPYHISASLGQDGDEEEWMGFQMTQNFEISLPSVQKYALNSFGKDYSPAIAITADTTLCFKNVCGVLELKLTGNVKVSKLTVTDNAGVPLWGIVYPRYYKKLDSSGDEFVLMDRGEYGSNIRNKQSQDEREKCSREKATLTLECDTPVQLTDEATAFYFVIPPVHNTTSEGNEELSEGFTLRVYDQNGDEVYTKVTSEDNTIHRSMVRRMPMIDVRSNSYTNLSAGGTANCYIAKPDGGTYSFYAGVRGNTTYPVGDIDKVVLLWETKNSTTEDVNLFDVIHAVTYNAETGYISFQTNEVSGNALIGVKDASDNILWSWHIWVTNYNPNASGATDFYNTTHELMDRNLGAIAKIPGDDLGYDTYGMGYQWGRKDPLAGTSWVDLGELKTFPSSPFNSYENINRDIAWKYAIAHPTTIMSGDGEWACDGLWGTPPIEARWSKEKFWNDPCPPGWQVADFDAFYPYYQSINKNVYSYISDSGSYTTFSGSEPDAIFPYKIGVWMNRGAYIGGYSVDYNHIGYNLSNRLQPVRCQRSSTVSDPRPVIDLSANGTANCYMVKPNRSYKFDATVKGNSNESVGTITSVSVVNYTQNGDTINKEDYDAQTEITTIGNVYLKDGYIYFNTSLDGNYGNAVIAVKDPHDRVLWSWHIWSVDYNPETSYDTVDGGKSGNRKMMKMNLGALNNNRKTSKSLGLMYQWGRKDPFLCARAYDSNSDAEYQGTHGAVSASDETSTLLYAIQHPGTAVEASDPDGEDWLSEPDNSLWGEDKTIYDPCPPGWKVPSRPVWDGEHLSTGTFEFGGLTMNSIWYPASGYRHHISFNLNYVGYEGHYWYSTPRTDGTAYSFFFNMEQIEPSNHYDKKAQANLVRCMKDE